MVSIGSLELNRSIVASIGKTPVDTAKKAKELGADILEFRIDLTDTEAKKALQELKKLGLPVIITNRMKQEGGAWTGSEEERIAELISMLPLSDAVDIELCARERDEVVRKARSLKKTVIISTHDFQRTPELDVMIGVVRESMEAGADIAKLAVTAQSPGDVLRLLQVTLRSKGKVCTIAMGEAGKHSRIITPVYGSVMTYGYIDRPAAPGQLRVDELRYVLKLL